jgi:hypothetical protein
MSVTGSHTTVGEGSGTTPTMPAGSHTTMRFVSGEKSATARWLDVITWACKFESLLEETWACKFESFPCCSNTFLLSFSRLRPQVDSDGEGGSLRCREALTSDPFRSMGARKPRHSPRTKKEAIITAAVRGIVYFCTSPVSKELRALSNWGIV